MKPWMIWDLERERERARREREDELGRGLHLPLPIAPEAPPKDENEPYGYTV